MKTVKEISEITGISIRALRYYDEIGLLKPTALTKANYRLYDDEALEKLQQILFFRELEIPLEDIKAIMDNPHFDKEQALLTQRTLLEHKRNRLNGIIELITDVINGVDDISFGAFNDEDIDKIIDHSLKIQSEKSIEAIIAHFGSLESFRDSIGKEIKDNSSHFIKLFGGKNKALDRMSQTSLDSDTLKELSEENHIIYQQFANAKATENEALAMDAVKKLANWSKRMFNVDNARYLLLKMAANYLNEQHKELESATKREYGEGITQYIGHTIQKYYGV